MGNLPNEPRHNTEHERLRPGRTLSVLALVGTWLLLLLTDLLLADWRISARQYGWFRVIFPIIGFLPTILRIIRASGEADPQSTFRATLRLTVILAVTTATISAILIIPFTYTTDAVPASFLALIPGRLIGLVALVGFPLIVEEQMNIFRYRDRGGVPILARIYAWLLAGILLLAQILPLRVDNDTTSFNTAIFPLAGLLGTVSFLLAIRLGWIINLRKRQKWGLLGLSALGFLCGAALLIEGENSSIGAALLSIMPGLQALVFSMGVSVLFFFMVIFVTSLFALPTADAIDRRNAEVSWLANLASLLTQSLDASDLIDSAISIARDATSASTAWIEVGEGEGTELQYGSAQRLPGQIARQLMDAPLPGGGTLRQGVLQQRRIQVLDRVKGVTWGGATGATGNNSNSTLRSVAGTPLNLGDRLLGVLYVAKERLHGFDRDDVVVLNALADQIALSIEHSQLIQRSIEQERLEQEMLIARDLQQRLLPKVMPKSLFYELLAVSEPASLVGGDYYDVIAFSEQTIGLIVADVSGKGASAALYMGVIKGIIQALSGSCSSPGELLARTNVALHGSIDQRWFVTMTCAEIIDHERRLRIGRAGHCPTLLIRGGKGEYSRPKGIGLGIAKPQLFEKNLEIDDLFFAPGDYTIFLSDGLPEARSPDGEEFGYELLISVAEEAAARNVNPQGMRDAIFAAMNEFTQGEAPHDDTTLAIIKWTS